MVVHLKEYLFKSLQLSSGGYININYCEDNTKQKENLYQCNYKPKGVKAGDHLIDFCKLMEILMFHYLCF
jgi:hypothetical protein